MQEAFTAISWKRAKDGSETPTASSKTYWGHSWEQVKGPRATRRKDLRDRLKKPSEARCGDLRKHAGGTRKHALGSSKTCEPLNRVLDPLNTIVSS